MLAHLVYDKTGLALSAGLLKAFQLSVHSKLRYMHSSQAHYHGAEVPNTGLATLRLYLLASKHKGLT